MGTKVRNFGLGMYRSALLSGVAGIIWFQTQFVTQRQFAAAMEANRAAMMASADLDAEVVQQLKWRLDQIERKLDQLPRSQIPPRRIPN